MVTFPNCKINLGLNILQKRKDGYHDLETVFYPITLNDVLEVVSSEGKAEFKNTGISGGEPSNNLCLKAFYILKKDYPHLPEIKMHLHKTIPVGAGLGGGSADAAFTLLLLNQKYDLNIPFDNLLEYASQLGSDCPFFLVNSPCFAAGRGEKIEKTNLSLSSYKILLINPEIHISTKELFSKIKPTTPQKCIKEIIRQPIETWKNDLKNDFEPIVFSKYEEIKKLKESLYKHKALYASMTGTGSTVYAIFNKKDQVDLNIKNNLFYKWIDLE
ncbi:MAG: 4-(cytidine 5'-diphospho)-2-C-methyl-D-erythritol kinase [Bacteroidota bacterium]|nr:4-(cytidine 5'-diphospho)-2-C-methyl-D-erythritol kinase [Bacteroidota bacterium]